MYIPQYCWKEEWALASLSAWSQGTGTTDLFEETALIGERSLQASCICDNWCEVMPAMQQACHQFREMQTSKTVAGKLNEGRVLLLTAEAPGEAGPQAIAGGTPWGLRPRDHRG